MSNFTTVPDVTVGQSFPPSLWESAIMNNLNLGVCRQLADLTLTGSQSSIDFTSLPATFAHLMIRVLARGDTAATTVGMNVRFNGDTSTNYDDGSQSIGSSQTSGFVGNISGANAQANSFGSYSLWIPHYAQATSFKNLISLGFHATASGGGNIVNWSQGVIWKLAPVAINEVTLLPGSGNFVAGSRASIYGLPA